MLYALVNYLILIVFAVRKFFGKLSTQLGLFEGDLKGLLQVQLADMKAKSILTALDSVQRCLNDLNLPIMLFDVEYSVEKMIEVP